MKFSWSILGVKLTAVFVTALASLTLGAALALAQTTYTWNQVGTASYTTDTNWTPTRTTPAVDDILVFNGGGSVTVTGVPTQTIGQLQLSNSSTVALQPAAGLVALTIAGGTGTDLDVPAGSVLNMSGGTAATNRITMLVGTGAAGSVSGSMSALNAQHILNASDASGITFNSGATFTYNPTGGSGNPFGNTGTANAVVFASGATLVSASGANPFGLGQPASKVLFQTGSLYRHDMTGTPAFSGRTYANFELNNAAASVSTTGGSPVSIDDLTITAGTINIGMTNTASAIRGNISVAVGATLNFNPASPATMNLSGTAAQSISNSGTLTFQANQNLNLNNAAGLTLLSNVSLGAATLTLTSGKVTTGANTLSSTNTTAGAISGAGAGRYIFGNLQKRVLITAGTGSQTFEVGGASIYAPVSLSTTTGAVTFDVLSSSTDGEHPNLGTSGLDGTKSVNRYWSLSSTPAAAFGNCDLVFNFDASDVDGGANTAAFDIEKYDSPNWTGLTEGTQGPTSTQALGVTSFSDFAIAEELPPTPVHNLDTGLDYPTIQAAHDAAPTLNGHTILADPGTYEEQVVLTKSLTIRGTSTASTIVKSPVTLSAFYTTPGPNNNYPIIFVNGADGTIIEDLTVDGDSRGNANYRFIGIGYWNAGGRVTRVDIARIQENPFSGAQHGVAVHSFNNTGGPYNLEVENVAATDFQKNGMVLAGTGLTVDVHDCSTAGVGYTAVIAQNGIQLSSGAQGSIANCAISDIGYSPATFVASGVLVFGAGGPVSVSGLNGPNTITNVQQPVYWQDANGTMDGISVSGGADFGPIFVYNSTASAPNGPRLDAARPRPLGSALDGEAGSSLRTPNQILSSFTVSVANSCLDGTDVAGTAGIGAYTEGGPLSVSAGTNEITDWDAGLTSYGTAATLSARENSISSNVTAGYDNTGSPTPQNAEFNWWGSPTGPSGDGGGTGDAVLGGNVDFTPWLTDGTDLAAGCGFQAVLPVHNIDTGLDYPTIQSAINDPPTLNGHTLVADPGTYPENVTLNKDLTIRGNQSGNAGCGRVTGAPDPSTESIITGAAPGPTLLTLVTGSAGSTIDGFSFIGGTRGIESTSGPIHGLSIINNHFAGFTGNGVFLNDPGTDITADGNNVDGTNKVGAGAIFHLDTDLFDGFHLTDNCILNNAFGTGFIVDGVRNMRPSPNRAPLIDGNRIEANVTGLSFGTRGFVGGTVSDNIFRNNGNGTTKSDGAQGGPQQAIITRNLFDNNGRYGLSFTTFGNVDTTRGARNCTITYNTFTANDSAAYFISSTGATNTHASTNHANFNDIVGNASGLFPAYGAVIYRGPNTIDVGCNWWGHIDGPHYPPANPNPPGDAIVAASALFAPWLDGSITGTPNCNQFPPVNTTTTLTSDNNPSDCGEKVNLIATIDPNTATGTVEFFEGGVSIGTAPVMGGVATLSTTTLPAGHRTITASYSGDADHNPSTSNKLVQNVHCAPGAETIVTVTPCDSMGWRRNNVLGNATVDITDTYPHVTGSLEFTSPGSAGKADYVRPNGNANLLTTLTALAVDLYRNSSSTSAVHLAPAIRLFVDNGNATDRFSYLIWEPTYNGIAVFPTDAWGTYDIFKHNFWQRAFKTSPPNRTIDIYNRTLADWLQPGTVTDGDGDVSNVVGPNARVLAYEIGIGSGWSGTFAGAADNFRIGFSGADSVFDFEMIPTTVVLTSDNNPAKYGTKINFTATVTPANATGSVEFFDGATSLGTAPVVGGQATLSVSNLTNGTHSITAVYSGDNCHLAATSNKVDQVVADQNCPTVTVVQPNAPLTILVVGANYQIQWTATDDKGVTAIDINLSRDNGNNWESIADDIANTGSYNWVVTGPGTNVNALPVFTGLIEVTATDAAGNTCFDRSDNPFAIYDLATETLLSLFQAEPIDAGIRLRWQIGDPDMVTSVGVERATSASGPWTAVTLDQSWEGDVSVGFDRAVVSGQTYFYRLQVAMRDGGTLTFGPLSGTAGVAIREFALTGLAPNPSRGLTRIEYTVPRASAITLRVVDIQGRQMALLVDGFAQPGRYQAAWNGRTERGQAPAGLYFVQLDTPAGRMVKRLALNP